jgi:tetratricopeptide (TPR) repeat protein
MNRRRGAAPARCSASCSLATPPRVVRERTRRRVRWNLTIVLVAACTIVTAAQHYEHALPADFDQPITLFKSGLGTFTRPISSPNRAAQAYFSQGYQLMYAFAKSEAGRSFRQAQKQDPNCAICYWGEAWAWGPYVNGRMTVEHAGRAYAAIRKAFTLSDTHADAKEQALIRALAVRYVERFDPSAHLEQDRAYADAMARVAASYPDDLDIATLYAEALFLLLPRPGAFAIDEPTVARVMATLEGALKRDLHHPGACHLYIHMVELTPEPGRAAACAEHLGDSIPGASHINHMPAHVWTRIGRWGDAVQASLRAWQSDQNAAKGMGFMTYPAHDLHMLTFAAAMDGQRSVALQAARGFSRLTDDSMLLSLVLVRFGLLDEVPTIGKRPAADIPGGVWDFAQGYAAIRRGDRSTALAALDRLQQTARTSNAAFRIHPAKTLLGAVAAILDGEIQHAAGNAAGEIAAFESAVALQDRLLVDDPEPLPIAARHWLGAALIDQRRFAEAERVYREDLVRHPHNGWALTGLQQALKGQGKPTKEVDSDLESSWSRADIQIRSSRY